MEGASNASCSVLIQSDPPYVVKRVSPSWSSYFGFKEDFVVGKTLKVCQGPATDFKALQEMIEVAVRKPGECPTSLLTFYDQAGDEVSLNVRVSFAGELGASKYDVLLAMFDPRGGSDEQEAGSVFDCYTACRALQSRAGSLMKQGEDSKATLEGYLTTLKAKDAELDMIELDLRRAKDEVAAKVKVVREEQTLIARYQARVVELCHELEGMEGQGGSAGEDGEKLRGMAEELDSLSLDPSDPPFGETDVSSSAMRVRAEEVKEKITRLLWGASLDDCFSDASTLSSGSMSSGASFGSTSSSSSLKSSGSCVSSQNRALLAHLKAMRKFRKNCGSA
mmetsp:Transcript_11014/g.24994  ORF Transcript_11014/g.24994 Transcript_11014/m.24994 type:complete len:336 (-) Transcript_11014:121-1128(-)|eukprot:766625-Hanusia_phi.AAC.3